MDAMQAECIIARIKNSEERKIARLLYNMGLNLVTANSVFYNAQHKPRTEIDLIFTSKKTTWIIEVSKNIHQAAQNKKRQHLREWKDEENWAKVTTKHELPLNNDVRLIYVDLSKEGGGSEKILDVLPSKGVIILYKDYIERLEKDLKKAKKEIRDAFVGLIEQAETDETAAK